MHFLLHALTMSSFITFPLILSDICSRQAYYCKKNEKGDNSVITCDLLMVLALCTFSHCPLSIIKFYSNSLNTFRDMLETSQLFKKAGREITP